MEDDISLSLSGATIGDHYCAVITDSDGGDPVVVIGTVSSSLQSISADVSSLIDGDLTVTLRVGSGPQVSDNSYKDTVAPTSLCNDVTVSLDAVGNASIATTDIDAGSTDDITDSANLTFELSEYSFTCNDIGEMTVTLTVTDECGNEDFCNSTVTVEDNIDPDALCTDHTVYLDASGTASVTVDDIDDGSNDNCSIESRSLDVTSFSCSDFGDNTVTLTVEDPAGNTATCTCTVTVEDTLLSVMSCTDLSVELDEMGIASIDVSDVDTGTTDNCGSPMLQLSQTSFSCSDIGEVSVSLTATDGSGNSNNCEVTVTVSGPDTDCDGDGLTNAEEADTYSTNPLEADTDGDGVTDGSEVADSSSPLEICDYVYSSVTLPKGEAWADADCDGDRRSAVHGQHRYAQRGEAYDNRGIAVTRFVLGV